MMKYIATVNNEDVEIEIHDKLSYSDVERIISTALGLCYDGTDVIAHFAEFALETALVLQVSNVDSLGLADSVESMWKLINENDIIEYIVKNVRFVSYGAIKKAFFSAYNEKLRIAYNPWSAAAESLAGLLNTMNANQASLAGVDINKLIAIGESIADKDESKIVDGILDFHEKEENK